MSHRTNRYAFSFPDLYPSSHTKINVVICFHAKVVRSHTDAVYPMSPPPVIDLEALAYKPLKKDPVPLNTRRSKVNHQLPLLLSFAVLLTVIFPVFQI